MFTVSSFAVADRWKQLESIDQYTDKQNLASAYNRIAFSTEKKGNFDTGTTLINLEVTVI